MSPFPPEVKIYEDKVGLYFVDAQTHILLTPKHTHYSSGMRSKVLIGLFQSLTTSLLQTDTIQTH